MEDKKKMCEMLLPVLQEIVTATFCSGYQKTANVTADSEAAMIIDIIKQCM